jgi:hypothetical protein
MLLNNGLWLVITSFIIYAPLVCYLDLKYRDIPHRTWLPLVVINLPIFLILLYTGTYQWWTLLLSAIGVIFWFVAMRMGIINGADFVFLSLISIFVVFLPSGHLMYLPFMIFLTAWTAITIWYIFTNNIKNNLRNGNKFSFDMIRFAIFKTIGIENRLPLMIPISLALISAVFLG